MLLKIGTKILRDFMIGNKQIAYLKKDNYYQLSYDTKNYNQEELDNILFDSGISDGSEGIINTYIEKSDDTSKFAYIRIKADIADQWDNTRIAYTYLTKLIPFSIAEKNSNGSYGIRFKYGYFPNTPTEISPPLYFIYYAFIFVAQHHLNTSKLGEIRISSPVIKNDEYNSSAKLYTYSVACDGWSTKMQLSSFYYSHNGMYQLGNNFIIRNDL